MASACGHLLFPACGCKPPPVKKAATPTPIHEEPDEDGLELPLDGDVEDPEYLVLAAELLKELDALAARDSLAEYCRQAWHVVEPSTELDWNWHHELICDVVQGMFFEWCSGQDDKTFKQQVLNAVFNVPPGSLKSRILSVFFPTWAWIHRPGWKAICLSVNEDATLRDGRASRDLLRSEWYAKSFKPEWRLKADQDAISNYGNTAGGERLSRASGSEIVGLRGDCVVGGTLVATESGDITIAELHRRWSAGGQVPRVWSMNHSTGAMELKKIQATRRIANRRVVEVRTETDNLLQCTRDHKIYSEGYYTQAAHLAGRGVSVLQRANMSVAGKRPATLHELPMGHTGLQELQTSVQTIGCGARQEVTPGGARYLLQSQLCNHGTQRAGNLEGLPAMQGTVQAPVSQGESSVLFEDVLPGARYWTTTYASQEDLPALSDRVPAEQQSPNVLHAQMCECDPLSAHVRDWELELSGQERLTVSGGPVGESSAPYSRARRVPLHSMQHDQERARVSSAPYRRESAEQHCGEFDHAVRPVSRAAPQISGAAVLSVNEVFEGGRHAEVDVYDIQVEGNHNFFANGVLVHNCIIIDDPNNPKEAESKTERDKVNDLWLTNIFNRVNDPLRSLRIGVQQRTHAGDWSGFVLETDKEWSKDNPLGWLHVVLPAEFEAARRCVTPWGSDPRTFEGQAIHEARMPADWLVKERQRMREKYAGQMQQRPTMVEGGRVKRSYFNWVRLDGGIRPGFDGVHVKRPRPTGCNESEALLIGAATHKPGYWDFDWVVISMDCAAKKTERGSQWGMLVVAGKGERRFVLDDRTRRGDILEILEVLKDLARMWWPDKILIEDKAAGDDLKTMIQREMSTGDFPMVVLEMMPTGTQGKEERLDACAPVLRNGFVHLLDGAEWLEEFVNELAVFPQGIHDDRVDSLTQVLNFTYEMFDLPSW